MASFGFSREGAKEITAITFIGRKMITFHLNFAASRLRVKLHFVPGCKGRKNNRIGSFPTMNYEKSKKIQIKIRAMSPIAMVGRKILAISFPNSWVPSA